MAEFDGLVAIVTGGASGIGAATVRTLQERGARVAALDLNPAGAPEGSLGIACDVTDRAAVERAVQQAADELGGVDIVVNNAGIGAGGTVAGNDDDEWLRVLNVNVVSIARVTAAALPHLRRSAHAAVVNTCSVVAVVGLPNRALYGATKGAVHALTLGMAADHLREGIRVNAVAPGTADTPWVGRLLDASEDREQAAAALKARQPMGRLVTADEVAHAIAYLASPLSASTTGTLLAVDGGLTGVRI
jgi:NAD(P)-dependent dehydrogenase (short-subunit alcohol dehydrogenase family)